MIVPVVTAKFVGGGVGRVVASTVEDGSDKAPSLLVPIILK